MINIDSENSNAFKIGLLIDDYEENEQQGLSILNQFHLKFEDDEDNDMIEQSQLKLNIENSNSFLSFDSKSSLNSDLDDDCEENYKEGQIKRNSQKQNFSFQLDDTKSQFSLNQTKENIEQQEKEEELQIPQISLKIMNFESLFGEEINEEDFLNYEFQDDNQVIINYQDYKHLNTQSILKNINQTESNIASDQQKNLLQYDHNQQINKSCNEYYFQNQNINDMKDQFQKLSLIENQDKNNQNIIQNNLRIDEQKGKNINFLEMMKELKYDKNQPIEYLRQIDIIEKSINEKKEEKKQNIGLFIGQEDDDDEDDGGFNSIGDTTTRNKKGIGLSSLEDDDEADFEQLEKELKQQKVSEVVQSKNLGFSTFSLYYNKALKK